jgi:hypothetical protein
MIQIFLEHGLGIFDLLAHHKELALYVLRILTKLLFHIVCKLLCYTYFSPIFDNLTYLLLENFSKLKNLH